MATAHPVRRRIRGRVRRRVCVLLPDPGRGTDPLHRGVRVGPAHLVQRPLPLPLDQRRLHRPEQDQDPLLDLEGAAGRGAMIWPARSEGGAMAAKTPVDMLAEVDLFSVLTKKEVKKIHDAGKEVNFRSGRVIVTEGETGVGFHLLLQGKAKVTVNNRLRSVLGPGDYFGEMAIIDRGPRSATVTADTD